jgi:hypothetical protein
MKPLPDTDRALVIRADFTDEAVWNSICAAVRRADGPRPDSYAQEIECVNDRAYSGLTAEQLLTLLPQEDWPMAAFLVDTVALAHPEHPILAVDARRKSVRTFRVVPRELVHIQSYWLYNMSFKEVAECADSDGIFRVPDPR